MISKAVVGIAAVAVLSACSTTTESASVPTAPSRTVPLTINVPAPCAQVQSQFAPLTLASGDYEVTVASSATCTADGSEAVLQYEAPIPDTGAVQVNPGSQPAATFAAEDVQTSVTVTYQVSGSGFSVASVDPPLRS